MARKGRGTTLLVWVTIVVVGTLISNYIRRLPERKLTLSSQRIGTMSAREIAHALVSGYSLPPDYKDFISAENMRRIRQHIIDEIVALERGQKRWFCSRGDALNKVLGCCSYLILLEDTSKSAEDILKIGVRDGLRIANAIDAAKSRREFTERWCEGLADLLFCRCKEKG